jgi:UDP-N-acetylmuramoylalanine--D-glutamate ligase
MNKPSNSNIQVVVGLGKTGLSCVRYLTAQHAHVAVTDSRENPPGLAEMRAHFPHVPLSLGKLDADLCNQAERLIVSPGLSLEEPAIAGAIAKGIPAIGDIELFALQSKAPVVAITGSNGKSTVTTLVGKMALQAGLDAPVGGNLGTPALDLLSVQAPDVYVLELSSFQLETTYSLTPKAAVILNLCEDHMDRYHNFADYLAAKQRVYRGCSVAVVNRDEPSEMGIDNKTHTISFGLDAPKGENFGLSLGYLAKGDTLLIKTDFLKIKGRHQLANALAALALGEAIGLPMDAMLVALRDFKGLAHRCQWVASGEGVDWYNDSKATNVGAAQAALAGLGPEMKGKLVVIAGGQGKNADFTPLRQTLKNYARCLILIGQDAPLIETALTDTVPIEHANTLEQAVSIAQQQAQRGDAVILAPACASLDMFNNFEHRGEVFMNAVKNHLRCHYEDPTH